MLPLSGLPCLNLPLTSIFMTDSNTPQFPATQAVPAKKNNTCLYLGLGCAGAVILFLIIGGILAYFGVKQGLKYVEKSILPEGQTIQGILKEAEQNPVKAAIMLNPELEWVGEDAAAGTFTIRFKETGETLTISAANARDGRIVLRNEKGEEITLDISGNITTKPAPDAGGETAAESAEESAPPAEN